VAQLAQGFREKPRWTASDLYTAPTIPGAVSVVIPAYNASHTLTDAVESCFSQTCTPDQVVIVDDGSGDMTPQVISDLCGDYPVYIRTTRHSTNLGVSAARNHGARIASGEFLIYLDADDVAPLQRVEQVLAEFADGAELVYGQKEYFEGNDWSKRTKRFHVEPPTVRNIFGSGCGGSTVSTRRSLHLDVGIWWDEVMCVAEDADILIACMAKERRVTCSYNVYSWMRTHPDSLTHRGDWGKMRAYMAEKYDGWLRGFFGAGH